jgi:ribosomal protein S7
MKIRIKKKNKLIDPKYSSIIIMKMINLLMKHGQKHKILNLFYSVFKKLKRIFNFNTITFFHKFIKENKPILFTKNIKVYGKPFQLPKFLSEPQKETKILI